MKPRKRLSNSQIIDKLQEDESENNTDNDSEGEDKGNAPQPVQWGGTSPPVSSDGTGRQVDLPCAMAPPKGHNREDNVDLEYDTGPDLSVQISPNYQPAPELLEYSDKTRVKMNRKYLNFNSNGRPIVKRNIFEKSKNSAIPRCFETTEDDTIIGVLRPKASPVIRTEPLPSISAPTHPEKTISPDKAPQLSPVKQEKGGAIVVNDSLQNRSDDETPQICEPVVTKIIDITPGSEKMDLTPSTIENVQQQMELLLTNAPSCKQETNQCKKKLFLDTPNKTDFNDKNTKKDLTPSPIENIEQQMELLFTNSPRCEPETDQCKKKLFLDTPKKTDKKTNLYSDTPNTTDNNATNKSGDEYESAPEEEENLKIGKTTGLSKNELLREFRSIMSDELVKALTPQKVSFFEKSVLLKDIREHWRSQSNGGTSDNGDSLVPVPGPVSRRQLTMVDASGTVAQGSAQLSSFLHEDLEMNESQSDLNQNQSDFNESQSDSDIPTFYLALGSEMDIYFVHQQGDINFDNKGFRIWVVLNDKIALGFYLLTDITTDQLLETLHTIFHKKKASVTISDESLKNREKFCLRYKGIIQEDGLVLNDFDSNSTLVFCHIEEPVTEHAGLLWGCRCGEGWTTERWFTKHVCPQKKLFCPMMKKQGWGKSQRENWALPREVRTRRLPTKMNKGVLIHPSKSLESECGPSTSHVSSLAPGQLEPGDGKKKDPRKTGQDSEKKENEVYRPPPTKLMKTKRKITSDEEVTDTGSDFQENSVKKSKRQGARKSYAAYFEKGEEKSDISSGDDSDSDANYVCQEERHSTEGSDSSDDLEIKEEIIQKPSRNTPRYGTKIAESDEEFCSCRCECQCSDIEVTRRKKKYEERFFDPAWNLDTKGFIEGRRPLMKKFALEQVHLNIVGEVPEGFTPDEEDLRFEEREFRHKIFSNARNMTNFVEMGPSLQNALNSGDYTNVGNEDLNKHMPRTYDLYRYAARKLMACYKRKVEKDGLLEFEGCTITSVHYRHFYNFADPPNYIPLVDPESLINEFKKEGETIGNMMHMACAARTLALIVQSKAKETSTWYSLCPKLANGKRDTSKLEESKGKWINLRSEVSNLISEAKLACTFTKWRKIAVSQAKDRRHKRDELMASSSLSDPQKAISNYLASDWFVKVEKEMADKYYKNEKPSPTQLDTYQTAICTKLSLYHGNRTQLMGSSLSYRDVNERSRRVQSPFKPIDKLQNMAPSDERLTGQVYDYGDGLLVYCSAFDRENPNIVDPSDENPDHLDSDKEFLLGSVIGPLRKHKTGYKYPAMLFLDPIDDVYCDMLEQLQFLCYEDKPWMTDVSIRNDRPFFINREGTAFVGRNGLNYRHFDEVNQISGTTQAIIRRMLCSTLQTHKDGLVRRAQEHALCHSQAVSQDRYLRNSESLSQALVAFVQIRKEAGTSLLIRNDGSKDLPALRHAPGQLERMKKAQNETYRKYLDAEWDRQEVKDRSQEISDKRMVTDDMKVSILQMGITELKTNVKISSKGTLLDTLLSGRNQAYHYATSVICRALDLLPLEDRGRDNLEGDLLQVTKIIVKSRDIQDPEEITATFLRKIEVKFVSNMLETFGNMARRKTGNIQNFRIVYLIAEIVRIAEGLGVSDPDERYTLQSRQFRYRIMETVKYMKHFEDTKIDDETGNQFDGDIFEKFKSLCENRVEAKANDEVYDKANEEVYDEANEEVYDEANEEVYDKENAKVHVEAHVEEQDIQSPTVSINPQNGSNPVQEGTTVYTESASLSAQRGSVLRIVSEEGDTIQAFGPITRDLHIEFETPKKGGKLQNEEKQLLLHLWINHKNAPLCRNDARMKQGVGIDRASTYEKKMMWAMEDIAHEMYSQKSSGRRADSLVERLFRNGHPKDPKLPLVNVAFDVLERYKEFDKLNPPKSEKTHNKVRGYLLKRSQQIMVELIELFK